MEQWTCLSLIMLGGALIEFGSKNFLHLETVYRDYTSLNHEIYFMVATLGFFVMGYGFLSAYVLVKAYLNSITNEEKYR